MFSHFLHEYIKHYLAIIEFSRISRNSIWRMPSYVQSDLIYKSCVACIPLSFSHDGGNAARSSWRRRGTDDENLTGAAAAAVPLIATGIKPSIRRHFARLFELFFELAEWRGAWMIVNKGVSSVLIRAERRIVSQTQRFAGINGEILMLWQKNLRNTVTIFSLMTLQRHPWIVGIWIT